MKSFSLVSIAVLVAVSGCATKRYPIMTDLSPEEVALMDCDDLRLEEARIATARNQIEDTADTDWRSVAGFLGDWGIGNAMAKSDASKALREREESVRTARVQKECDGSIPAAPEPTDS
jgi:hypothetical protein